MRDHADPDHTVTDFVASRITRRELIARLTALGAAAAGAARMAHAAPQNGAAPVAAGPTFNARSLDHIALTVADIPRSRAWYERHLGLRVTSESRTACFMNCENNRDFLALFKGEPAGLHHYSYAIENYSQADAADRLRAAGLTPKLRGQRIYFDDPDGIEVQVSQG